MEQENKNNQSQASLDNEIKQVPYFPASDDCGDLGSVVPKNFAMEQKNFNNILKANYDVSKFVMNRLGYKNLDVFCASFAKEQIDAIATAIYNFERNGFGLIVSDQTGLGKGRVVAGLIRYSIYHLGKVPVFWTEKPTLFSDIYRDLIDIKFDVGVPIKVKKQNEVDGDSLSEKEIIKLIKSDIKENEELRIEYELDEDFDLNDIFNDQNVDVLEDIIERYREHLTSFGYEDDNSYEAVNGTVYRKEVNQAILDGGSVIEPFSTTSQKIKDKEGNILYEIKSKDIAEAIRRQELNNKVKLVMMTYSQIRKTQNKTTGQLTPKFKLIQKICNDSILILDESHNAAGRSGTFRTMTNLLLSAKDVVYVSATWAKRPDNMPLYALRTSIRESFLSAMQLSNAFENGGLALQEVVSSALVKTGQLVRRERTFRGETDYYYANPDSENPEERETGLNQINKIDRVASAFDTLTRWESQLRTEFKKIVKKNVPDEDEQKLYKFTGGFSRYRFLLFNYFLLGIKIQQATKEAISQLKSGKKVIIALANTLESAFSNIKRNYELNEKYDLGDLIQNDFSLILKYIFHNSIQFKKKTIIVNDAGQEEETKETFFPLNFNGEQKNNYEDVYGVANEWMDSIQYLMDDFLRELNIPLGIPLSPIDQIKHIVKSEGFTIEEITGRSKCLEFSDDSFGVPNFEEGVLSKREKMGTDRDVINMFNFNKIDALIINQSGSTGVSMHAVPTTDKNGNLVAPVNVVPANPPTSLLPKNEVKQRCMIIMQMELDINREIQKLGRVERSGQVFPPIYKYIFSAIPSESRLAAMMQRKLKSLMANTKGGSEQGKDLFNADDLFNQIAVEPWNLTIKNLGLGSAYGVANKEEIYKKTSLFYFMPYEMQRDFFNALSTNLKNHIEYLKALGLYFGEVTFKDYASKTSDIIPYIIGDNNSVTDFGRHTYAERVEVTEFDEKNTESAVRKAIVSNLTINKNRETFVYATLEDYTEAMTKNVNEMVDDYVSVLNSYKADNMSQIERLESDKADVEKSLKSYPNLAEANSIREKIEENERKKKENIQEINVLLEEATEEATRKASLFTRENQQLQTSINDLVAKERGILKEFESVVELRKKYATATSSIKYFNEEIEIQNRRVEKRNSEIQEQMDYKEYFLNKLNSVGNVFDVKNYAESLEYSEDGFESKYVYALSSDEKAVLVGARFNFNANDHFTAGTIDLKFKTATNDMTLQGNNVLETKSESEIARGKKPTAEINDNDLSYQGMWDGYVSTIYTGRQTEKVFLSGNLLRGLAFNYMIGASGNITKYNTADGKLKTSLVLNQASSNSILPRFNEGVNYPMLMDFSQDNFERMFFRAVAMNAMVGKKMASQLLFDSAKTFAIIYPNEQLLDMITQYYEKYADEKGLPYVMAQTDEDVITACEGIIRENAEKLIITFSSQSQDIIKTFDNIVSNIGSELVESADEIFEGAKSSYVIEAMVYTEKNKQKTPKVKGEQFLSPIQLRYNAIKNFNKGATSLLEDVFIVDNAIISERANERGGQNFFIPIWNLTLTYDLFLKMLNFLEAKYVRMLATTSKELLDKATPAYIFDFSESATGSIDANGSQVIEGIAENTIESIEDVLTEFVEFYQS
jgi:hypothetical protein